MTRSKRLRLVIVGFSLAAAAFYLFSLGIGRVPSVKQVVAKGKIGRLDILGPVLSSEDTIDAIKQLRDDGVAAILVRIDSPGGAVSPSQDIYRELMKLRRAGKLKIVASIGNLGASGGYYIAAAAHKVYASPGSLVGSIGVIFELTRFDELFKKIGVASEVVKSGPYKDIGSPFRRTTDDERRLLQRVIDDTHRQFVTAVSEGRNLDREKIAEMADGRIFTGAQARESGLVDELGGLEDALEGAARLCGIEGKPQIIKPSKKWTWRKFLEETSSSFLGRLQPSLPLGLHYLWHP